MRKNQAVRQRMAAAFALIAVVLAFGATDLRNTARADSEPDFLVLNPDRE